MQRKVGQDDIPEEIASVFIDGGLGDGIQTMYNGMGVFYQSFVSRTKVNVSLSIRKDTLV